MAVAVGLHVAGHDISTYEARIGGQPGAVEAARSGVTTVLDNHYAPTDFESTLAVADAPPLASVSTVAAGTGSTCSRA